MKSLRTLTGFLVFALLGACFTAGMVSAKDSQGKLTTWGNLRSLTTGQEIRVKMKNDTFYQGAFQSLSDDGITLQQAAGAQMLPRKDVLRVSLKGQNHRTRNAVSGAVLGGLVGLAGGLEADHIINSNANCTLGPDICHGGGYPPNPHWAIIGTLVVGAAGAAIGGAIPSGGWRDIYRAH